MCAFLCASLHMRPRVQRAPGLPCALCLKREQTKLKPRTKNRVARTKSHAWPILRDARKGALLRMRFSSGEALMVRRREAPSRTMATRYARGPHERSDMRDAVAPDIAEPVIGRAFARTVGSSGLRLLSQSIYRSRRASRSRTRDSRRPRQGRVRDNADRPGPTSNDRLS